MGMIDGLTSGIIILLRAILKAVVGFIIIPLGIMIDQVKPGWEVASLPVKIFTGILLVPIVIVLYFAIPWWKDFKIAK